MPEVNAISESRFVGEKEFKVNHDQNIEFHKGFTFVVYN